MTISGIEEIQEARFFFGISTFREQMSLVVRFVGRQEH